MLSDLLKDYVGDALKYYSKFALREIQLSAKGIANTVAADSFEWSLSSKGEKSLSREKVLDAIDKDWYVIGTEDGEQYRVVVAMNFIAPSGADVVYNDYLVITVGEDEEEEDVEEEESSVDSPYCKMPTKEDFESAMEEMKEAFKQWQEFHNNELKKRSRCKGSIHSCEFYPDDSEFF